MPSPRYVGIVFVVCMLVGMVLSSSAQARPETHKPTLEGLAARFQSELQARRGAEYNRLLLSTEPAPMALNESPKFMLMFVDERGYPFYYRTLNLLAAETVSTDEVWPGGSGGHNLTGSGTPLGRLGIWDGGGVLTTHQEFGGRVTQMDAPGGTHFHATHVAGTMVAGGFDSDAIGMSYQGTLAAYDWVADNAEMATAAGNGMVISNHSYGYACGWEWDSDWYWFGDTDISATEDYYFGFYSFAAEDWDEIAHNAPYYTIVTSAGNDRNDFGPGPGGGHWVWDNHLGDWVWSTDTRDPDGGADEYDCISHGALAKNVVSVGAVHDIAGGYSSPPDVGVSSFTSYGPTDDGRIKPDLVANGVGLYSCTNTSNSSYASYSGTSMASPNLSGSAGLIYPQSSSMWPDWPELPLSSTIKAVLIQTADEAGTAAGPDYEHGWGLLNTLHAADLLVENVANPFLIYEDSLLTGESDTLSFQCDGADSVRVTIAWTDPPGTSPPPSLNPTTLMLVNDLDLRLTHMQSMTEYEPYVLDPDNPGDAADTGDNFRDNVEQIHVSSPPIGDYMVVVSHKGALSGGSQWYSLVASEPMSTQEPGPPLPAMTFAVRILFLGLAAATGLVLLRRYRTRVRSSV